MNWLSLVPYLLAAAVAAGATWPLARAPLQGDIADLRMENAGLREAHTESLRLAVQAASARVQRAQESGEAVSARLAAALTKNDQLTEEKQRAIKAATNGRACLSGRALRVLDGATGITVAPRRDGVPAPAGQPAAEAGAAAAHPDVGNVATDTDLGGWVLDAGRRHEACREQLGALIDWINTNDPLQEPKQ